MTRTRPKPGDPAPQFEGRTATGETLRLADFRGRKLVLYFYPMDFTPGCTAQACSLRDRGDEIRARGAAVVGVSTQDEASHARFSQMHRLDFPLLADRDRAIGKAYGAIGAGGGLFPSVSALMGVSERITFVIDAQGVIEHVIDRPSCPNHAEEVLKLL